MTIARDTALVLSRTLLLYAGYEPDGQARPEWLRTAIVYVETANDLIERLSGRSSDQLSALVGRIDAAADNFRPGQLAFHVGELEAIMSGYDLDFPDLPAEDWDDLSRYIEGNLLLLECLDQAVVAGREAIKERLLLLP